ncbi:hypothetical protein Mal48_06470 [Thalassoglobus polymorphus]|uniref:Uncharacterized protein n=2 Tax=Thalassoglobus polymorphus TaxID=2527994 RepID=A0A517QIH7_9PLAN|nr:hypothetical protein Mal48_06470 [Thalassoglobus polymorphus]
MSSVRVIKHRTWSTAFCAGGCFLMLTLLALSQSGCLNSLVMAGKVILGDPKQPSGFEVATGKSLVEEEKQILIHCSAPSYISSEHDTLTSDLQLELISRMRRNGLLVMSPDAAADVLDNYSGQFDPKLLAMEMEDVGYIFHIQVDSFSFREDNSPNLFRGRTKGRVIGYEVRGEEGGRHSVQVYDQQFSTQHPGTHPIPSDQMPKSVFIRRFIDKLADDLGHSFYSVHTGELFAQ